ncbi:MAG: methyl-accepting chemotaxis protein [Lachnospiraceae bacterium]|nr:methyl-accepting chemotaxis protein [Lachnospiraceae bacterium]
MAKTSEKAEKSGSIGFLQKLSTKITLLVSAIVLVTVAVQVVSGVVKASNTISATYLNYAKNLAEASASGVDFATSFGEEAYGGYAQNLAEEAAVAINFSKQTGEESYMNFAQNLAEEAAIGVNLVSDLGLELTKDRMDRVLGSITIKGVEGSYAYMVAPNGIMLWHPKADKIGSQVENAAVKGIVADLQAGKTVEDGAVLYEYNGALKLAGYSFTSQGYIMLVTADYDAFMKIDYDQLLGNITIHGVEGSYAYMVSPDGTMLWHPDSSKIGNPVENAAVKGIVADLQAGKTVENNYCVYDYKGAKKLAGYAFNEQGNIVIVTADYDKLVDIDYDLLVGEIEIDGVAGSYAYMVSPDGTMLYHKDPEKIGNPVENAAVKGIVADLQAGKTVENGACTYEYKGADKVAGYAFTSAGNIVIVTADKNVMMADVTAMRTNMIIYGIVCLIVAIAIVALASSMLLKGLSQLVPVINKTAALDFSADETADMLSKKSDEVGAIAKSVGTMRESLSAIVGSIDEASVSIDYNVDELQTTIENVGNLCQDNSATTQELAAGMEETSATTTSINESVINVKENALGIGELADEGAEASEEVLSRANNLAETTRVASEKTINIYESVKVKAAKAIEASKAVEKIEELTGTIMAISSQTSLLSLNASIEAARAGEAGRGFAVVASEISNLATQTSAAVKDISDIVVEVTAAVDQMADCLGETTGFLETNVLTDYEEFGKVSEQYKSDADTFGTSMGNIKASVSELNEALVTIVEAINGIDTTVNEAATGVTDIAEKTTNMVNETAGSVDKVDECKNAVEELKAIIAKFTL